MAQHVGAVVAEGAVVVAGGLLHLVDGGVGHGPVPQRGGELPAAGQPQQLGHEGRQGLAQHVGGGLVHCPALVLFLVGLAAFPELLVEFQRRQRVGQALGQVGQEGSRRSGFRRAAEAQELPGQVVALGQGLVQEAQLVGFGAGGPGGLHGGDQRGGRAGRCWRGRGGQQVGGQVAVEHGQAQGHAVLADAVPVVGAAAGELRPGRGQAQGHAVGPAAAHGGQKGVALAAQLAQVAFVVVVLAAREAVGVGEAAQGLAGEHGGRGVAVKIRLSAKVLRHSALTKSGLAGRLQTFNIQATPPSRRSPSVRPAGTAPGRAGRSASSPRCGRRGARCTRAECGYRAGGGAPRG